MIINAAKLDTFQNSFSESLQHENSSEMKEVRVCKERTRDRIGGRQSECLSWTVRMMQR